MSWNFMWIKIGFDNNLKNGKIYMKISKPGFKAILNLAAKTNCNKVFLMTCKKGSTLIGSNFIFGFGSQI